VDTSTGAPLQLHISTTLVSDSILESENRSEQSSHPCAVGSIGTYHLSLGLNDCSRIWSSVFSFIEYRTSSDSWIPQNEFLYLMIFKSSMMRAITTKVDWCYIRKCCRNWSLQIATSYIKSTAPKQYQEKLIPNYRKFPGHQLDVKVNTFGSLAIGCKRVIFDTDFCNALHRPNFDLSWDNAKQIVENGIITTKG